MFQSNEEHDYEKLAYEQRLKAAVHYTVGKICESVGEKENVTYNRKVIAALNEVVWHQASLFSKDVECFANHGKRSVVNVEDVKLLARRNQSLLDLMKKLQNEINETNVAEKERKKKSKQSKKSTSDEAK